MIDTLISSTAWRLAGWTMLHFLWVGGVIGLILGLIRRALRNASPNLRYGMALLGLASLALAPAIIAWNLASNFPVNPPLPQPITQILIRSDELDPRRSVESPGDLAVAPLNETVSALRLLNPPNAGTRSQEITTRIWFLEPLASGLPMLWLVGSPTTFLLLGFGFAGAQRLRRRTKQLVQGEFLERFQRMTNEMGIRRTVRLGTLDRLNGPILIGIARPLVVLPASALSGWSPDLVEMALLHELAHIRRHDNLINLFQCIIEAFLFFHPVVWWTSRWARLERELCCDELVIARTGQPRRYAELLAAIAMPNLRWSVPLDSKISSAMATPPIVERIRHILVCKENHSMRTSPAFLTLAGICLIAPAALIASQAGSSDQEPATDSKPNQVATTKQEQDQAQGKTSADPRLANIYQRILHAADIYKDVQRRAYIYQHVAAAKARAGDRAGARRDFDTAVDLAEQVTLDESTFEPHLLHWIAKTQAKTGFRTEAIENLKKLTKLSQTQTKSEIQRFSLLANIAELQADLDDELGQRETTQLIRQYCNPGTRPTPQIYGYQHLFQTLSQSGNLSEGLSLSKDPNLYKGLEEKEIRQKRYWLLFALLREVKPGSGDNATIDSILGEAKQTILTDRGKRAEFPLMIQMRESQELTALAKAFLRLERYDKALEIARTIEPPAPPLDGKRVAQHAMLAREALWNKASLLLQVGEKYLEADQKADALKLANETIQVLDGIKEQSDLTYPLQRALTIMAAFGETTRAMELSTKLDPMRRGRVLIAVATTLDELGKNSIARSVRESLVEILQAQLDSIDSKKLAENQDDTQKHDRLRQELGLIHEQLENSELALETIQRMVDSTQEQVALGKLAAIRTKQDNLDGAIKVAESIGSPKGQSEILEQILFNLSQ